MTRKKPMLPQVKAASQPNQPPLRRGFFAFYTSKAGKPSCRALDDVYYLKDKSRRCPGPAGSGTAPRRLLYF
jgi:hypothetical protein